MNAEIEKLKSKFRTWYGTLSVSELSTNSQLVQTIAELETLLKELAYE